MNNLTRKSLKNSENILKHAIHEVDNPALTALSCSPDYLTTLIKWCIEGLTYDNNLLQDDSCMVVLASETAHRVSVFMLEGRATANKSPDINFGESNTRVALFQAHYPLSPYFRNGG